MSRPTRGHAALTPLRYPLWRTVWLCGFVGNVAMWMQLVGAQWLMGTLTRGTAQVALLQTALGLPFFLVAIPAGAFGDTRDRRRVVVAGQGLMSLAAAGLTLFTATGRTTPALLFVLVAVVGAGQAVGVPSWLALQPTLLPPDQIGAGAALEGAGAALARAIGPALAGVLIVIGGPATDFAVSAAGALATTLALIRLSTISRPPASVDPLGIAVRSGLVYVRTHGELTRILIRIVLLSALAGAVWALLPTLARDRLHMDAAGYGALLGCVGVGSVAAAAALPRLKAHLAPARIVTAAFLLLAAASLDLSLTRVVPPAVIAVIGAGSAWVAAVAVLDAAAQGTVVDSFRARALAIYESTFQSGLALSGFVWGVLAAATSISFALLGATIALCAATILPAWERSATEASEAGASSDSAGARTRCAPPCT